MSFEIIHTKNKYRITGSDNKYNILGTGNKYTISRIYLNTLWDKWNPYFSFLWTGLVSYAGPNYLISDFPDRRKITITGLDFDDTFIPGESSATFTLPPDDDFITDDLDHLWFSNGIQNDVTVSDLVSGEYRTVVKYANDEPYDVTAIGLLRHDAVFTSVLENELAADFDLWLFWLGLINYTL